MGTRQLMLLAFVVYAAGLSAVTLLTRPQCRRFLGALSGGLAVAVVGVGIEIVCQSLGYWHYPSTQQRTGPLAMYPVLVLMFAGYSLIGWRLMRRFGGRGWAAFLAAVTAVGVHRDYFVAGQKFGVIALAPGFTTALIDAMCWAGLTALAYGVMRLAAGPATSDFLTRWPWEPC